jgi:ATP-dependent Clp protease ATP-binding subunit ClpC
MRRCASCSLEVAVGSPLLWLAIGYMAGLFAPLLLDLGRRLIERPRHGATSAGPDPAAQEVRLPQRLHTLATAIEPFAQTAAHLDDFTAVRELQEAVALLADRSVPPASVTAYALGYNWVLSCAGLAALKERGDAGDIGEQVAERVIDWPVWNIQLALELLATLEPKPRLDTLLAGFREWWNNNTMLPPSFARYLDSVDDLALAEEGERVRALAPDIQRQLKVFLGRVNHPLADMLAGAIGVPQASAEPALLTSVGRFWSDDREARRLVAPECWQDDLDAAREIATRAPPRSLLVSGEPLSGKSSFLRLLAMRLAEDGWRIFEAGGADLMAGQQYIGQLEGRIRQVTEELDVSRKIIWYIPDLLALALSGTHQGQSASMLDQILPAIAAGRILVWAEATPASAARLFQFRPKLRRALDVVMLESMTPEESAVLAGKLAECLASETGHILEPSLPRTAVDVACHYLNAASLPGSALALLKLTVLRPGLAAGSRLDGKAALSAVAQLTGLPPALLDGSERIDLAGIRGRFESRVIGQPEAVGTMIDRIAMLKSGLNDPDRPIGVFLFAGPTGTGKTELAKTTAEYLFGSVERMIRLDMSEYQAQDSIPKILGAPGLPLEAETLISRIRKQPYSLVLLDEFEKSHPQIWDLFLQVFDEGRLTDTFGQTADFRHCLIILTTNLGATSHQGSGLGFAPGQSGYTSEQVLRAIGQTFRPEFQNRLDKVIVFRPLTRELMRGILKKELGRVFERRGLKDRAWAVEWEASALEFLLEKGFSPAMGARPLKRAIDQYVIAPLAATIVERRFPEGDQFVFVRSDGAAIEAEFVDPDGDDGPAAPDQPALPAVAPGERPRLLDIAHAPDGSRSEIDALAAAQAAIARALESPLWLSLKARLGEEINAPEFWSRDDRLGVLTRFALMDRVAVAAGTAASLQARLASHRGKSGKAFRELVGRLALQVHLVNEGIRDVHEEAPVEVALAVEAALDSHAGDKDAARVWAREVAGMYRAWARKRNMQASEIEGVTRLEPAVLMVAGFGAHRTLQGEAGLHVLEQPEGPSSGRWTVRVVVATLPPGEVPKSRLPVALKAALEQARRPGTVVRRYRKAPSPMVRSGDGSWRSGKLEAVLAGEFDVIAKEPA